MAIYEITNKSLRKIEATSFSKASVRERTDLQRLLRSQIDIVSPDTLIIAEEFGEWEDSRRRIDLLGIDQDAKLVVIELKRNDDGEEMDLQAIRYAAMVSTMTFEKAIEVYTTFLAKHDPQRDARKSLLDFLSWEEPDEDRFAQDVRMVLASADFSKELTTAVMWLNEQGLDIRCIRMKPYHDSGRILVDVQQAIPLPEAADYQVKLREKAGRQRNDRAQRHEIRKRFWSDLLIYARTKTDLHQHISPSEDSNVGAGAGISGLSYRYGVTRHTSHVELHIARGPGCEQENKRLFDCLHHSKDEIERKFGEPLEWNRLDDKQRCLIRLTIPGGYRNIESQWLSIHTKLVDRMIRLEHAFSPEIGKARAELS